MNKLTIIQAFIIVITSLLLSCLGTIPEKSTDFGVTHPYPKTTENTSSQVSVVTENNSSYQKSYTWKIYNNQAYKYSIEYPSGWSIASTEPGYTGISNNNKIDNIIIMAGTSTELNRGNPIKPRTIDFIEPAFDIKSLSKQAQLILTAAAMAYEIASKANPYNGVFNDSIELDPSSINNLGNPFNIEAAKDGFIYFQQHYDLSFSAKDLTEFKQGTNYFIAKWIKARVANGPPVTNGLYCFITDDGRKGVWIWWSGATSGEYTIFDHAVDSLKISR